MTPTGRGPDDFVETNNFQEQTYVDQYNHEARTRYGRMIGNINASLAAGRPAPMPAPPVPTAMSLGPPDSKGLRFAIMTPIPLGTPLPLLPDTTHANDPKPPGTIQIGAPETDAPGWFVAGPQDTVRSGEKVPGTSANGVSGMFQKYGGIGTTGWYLKLN